MGKGRQFGVAALRRTPRAACRRAVPRETKTEAQQAPSGGRGLIRCGSGCAPSRKNRTRDRRLKTACDAGDVLRRPAGGGPLGPCSSGGSRRRREGGIGPVVRGGRTPMPPAISKAQPKGRCPGRGLSRALTPYRAPGHALGSCGRRVESATRARRGPKSWRTDCCTTVVATCSSSSGGPYVVRASRSGPVERFP